MAFVNLLRMVIASGMAASSCPNKSIRNMSLLLSAPVSSVASFPSRPSPGVEKLSLRGSKLKPYSFINSKRKWVPLSNCVNKMSQGRFIGLFWVGSRSDLWLGTCHAQPWTREWNQPGHIDWEGREESSPRGEDGICYQKARYKVVKSDWWGWGI